MHGGVDPSGMRKSRSSKTECCDNKKYDPKTHCCENGSLKAKVTIWVCERPLASESTFKNWLTYNLAYLTPKLLDISHSYICCSGPNKNCYGKQAETPTGKNDPQTGAQILRPTVAGDPIPKEPYTTGSCKAKKVCPSIKKKKCNKPRAELPYSLTNDLKGDFGSNCHFWANYGNDFHQTGPHTGCD